MLMWNQCPKSVCSEVPGSERKQNYNLTVKTFATFIIKYYSVLQAKQKNHTIGPDLIGCLDDDPDEWAESWHSLLEGGGGK